MKIDLDNCCFNRPYDDQSYMKNIDINMKKSFDELYSVLRMLQKKIDNHEIEIINNPYDEFCTKVPLSDFLNEKIKPEFIRMYFKDFEQNQLYFLEADIYMCYGALRKIDSLKMEYVIFTCDSYVDISKRGFLDSWNQCPQSTLSYEPKLLLGEVYRILERKDDYCVLWPGDFKIKPKDLVPYEPNKFNIRKGDVVKICKQTSEWDNSSLTLGDRFNFKEEYKVIKIINSFFAILINSYGQLSGPIRFSHLTKKKEKNIK